MKKKADGCRTKGHDGLTAAAHRFGPCQAKEGVRRKAVSVCRLEIFLPSQTRDRLLGKRRRTRFLVFLSSFTAKKLDLNPSLGDNPTMRTNQKKAGSGAGNTAETVRRRIEASGERVWRLADFDGMPFMAVAQALSRLTRQGVIQRLGKGLYYRPGRRRSGRAGPTRLRSGPCPCVGREFSRPGSRQPTCWASRPRIRRGSKLATNGPSLPRLIVGKETSSTPAGRSRGGRSPRRTPPFSTSFATGGNRVSCLPRKRWTSCSSTSANRDASSGCSRSRQSEPPRVRAMLGAIGQQLGQPESRLSALRKSLNPLSRFDFGILAVAGTRAGMAGEGAQEP